MRAALATSLALLGFAAAPSAMAADGFYLAPSIGLQKVEERSFETFGVPGTVAFDKSWTAGLAVGYRTGMFRFELEGNYGRLGLDSIELDPNLFPGSIDDRDADLDTWSGFAAAYVDFDFGSILPFVGAGVGAWHTDIGGGDLGDGFEAVDGDTKLALMGEIGLTMTLSDRLQLAPSYRYTWVDDDGGLLGRTKAHSARLTLRYGF